MMPVMTPDVEGAVTTDKSATWRFLMIALALSSQIASHLVSAACAREARDSGLVQGAELRLPHSGSGLGPAVTNHYYVDSIYGSDANPGISAEAPWRTLAPVHANDFVPGDVVHFKRGSSWTGGLVINDSGVEGNPITFTTYGTANRPVFANPGSPDNWTIAVEIDADWVVVEGFLVQDAYWNGVRISRGSNHNIVRDIEVTNVGIGIGIYGERNLATGNHVHDLHLVVNTPGGDDDFGAVGIWLFNSNNEVSYNTMVNCKAPSHDYVYDGGAIEWHGHVDNCYVHHNIGMNCNGFLEVGGGSARNTVVAYNVSVNDGAFSYINLGGHHRSEVENFRVENNTIVDTNEDDGGRFIAFGRGDPALNTLIMRNNIFYVNKRISYKSSFSHDHNLYFRVDGSTELGLSLGEADQVADPLFVDVAGHDFHLQPGSPAIDAGAHIGYSLDFDDRPVPVGDAPDLGAFEYQTGSPTPTPTAMPTRTATPPNTSTPTQTNTPTVTPRPTETATPTSAASPTPTPTVMRTPTATPPNTSTPTQTNTPTVTPSPTETATPTSVASPTPTPTVMRTPTATPPNTSTPTQTNTPMVTPSPTETATPTSAASPTPGPSWLYLPNVLRDFSPTCVERGYTFREEFEDSALDGWSVSLEYGQQQVTDGILHLWTQPSIDRFPLVWRNDLLEGGGSDFAVEARFRHSGFAAYGTTIALNSATYDGDRVPAGVDLPPGIEDILSIHHVVDRGGGIYRFAISMLDGRLVWNGTPGDSNWHVVRVTLEHGEWYTLHVDGQRVGSARSSVRPRSIYIGNPTIQPWFGPWTQLYVDYLRISRCLDWGP
jgi:hypothetical protein